MDLHDQIAVVTGASSGIGRETCLLLGRHGAGVALLARREDRLRDVAAQVSAGGGRALTLPTDVTDEGQIRRAVERTVEHYGRIDILIHVAGLGVFQPLETLPPAEWRRQIDVMLTGSYLVTHHALPHLYERKRGKIVFITSLWGPRKTAPECSAYNAAKAGVSAMADALREEIKDRRVEIGVTEIRPGTVDTEFFDKASYRGEVDARRVLHATDVAEAVLYAVGVRAAVACHTIELEGVNPPY